MPAGIHVLPYVRRGDHFLPVIVVNADGEAVYGPEYVDPTGDLMAEGARLLDIAEATGDVTSASHDDDAGNGEAWMRGIAVHREPCMTREIL